MTFVKKAVPICDTPHEGHDYGAGRPMPNDESFIDSAMLFQLMGDATRLKILYCLCQHEYCVYDIAQLVDMSAPAISHHLRSLRQMGIISSRRDGKHVFYSLSDSEDAEKIRKMISDVMEVQR